MGTRVILHPIDGESTLRSQLVRALPQAGLRSGEFRSEESETTGGDAMLAKMQRFRIETFDPVSRGEEPPAWPKISL